MAALEQWEIDLRNQLENIINTGNTLKEKKITNTSVENNLPEWLLYSIVSLFFFLSALFILDLKTDFIGKLMYSKPKVEKILPIEKKQKQEEEQDTIGEDKATELMERIRKSEEKLFVLGMITNENAAIIKNNLNRKDIVTISKDWKLTKNPKYILMSEKDKEYFEKVQNR